MVSSLYSPENPVFASFCFYAAFLCCKMFFMAVLVGWQRYVKRAFANPEDTTKLPGAKIRTDEDVERLRRAHLNDLENIVPFLVLAFIYVSTSPSEGVALAAFRIFTFSRLLHTFVYAIVVVEQPARFLAFMGGMIVNLYLTLSIMAFYWSAI
nr:mGST1-like protein 3 [Diaphanosoma celebensis]